MLVELIAHTNDPERTIDLYLVQIWLSMVQHLLE